VTVVYDFVVYLSGGVWKLGKALKAIEFTLGVSFLSQDSKLYLVI